MDESCLFSALIKSCNLCNSSESYYCCLATDQQEVNDLHQIYVQNYVAKCVLELTHGAGYSGKHNKSVKLLENACLRYIMLTGMHKESDTRSRNLSRGTVSFCLV